MQHNFPHRCSLSFQTRMVLSEGWNAMSSTYPNILPIITQSAPICSNSGSHLMEAIRWDVIIHWNPCDQSQYAFQHQMLEICNKEAQWLSHPVHKLPRGICLARGRNREPSQMETSVLTTNKAYCPLDARTDLSRLWTEWGQGRIGVWRFIHHIFFTCATLLLHFAPSSSWFDITLLYDWHCFMLSEGWFFVLFFAPF